MRVQLFNREATLPKNTKNDRRQTNVEVRKTTNNNKNKHKPNKNNKKNKIPNPEMATKNQSLLSTLLNGNTNWHVQHTTDQQLQHMEFRFWLCFNTKREKDMLRWMTEDLTLDYWKLMTTFDKKDYKTLPECCTDVKSSKNLAGGLSFIWDADKHWMSNDCWADVFIDDETQFWSQKVQVNHRSEENTLQSWKILHKENLMHRPWIADWLLMPPLWLSWRETFFPFRTLELLKMTEIKLLKHHRHCMTEDDKIWHTFSMIYQKRWFATDS